MICVSISNWQQLEPVLDSGADLLELRLDLIREDPKRIFSCLKDGMRTLMTCRPGVFSESERLQMLKTSMDLGATYVDVELESTDSYLQALIEHARSCQTKVILSYHNFELTPEREELETLMKRCYERGGDLAKIAVQVNGPEDVKRLLNLYNHPGKKVVLGMGKLGRITRVAGPYLGAEFTFAAPGEGAETAPGQLSYNQLKGIYKAIDAS